MLEGDEGTNCPRLCRFFFGDSLRSKINIWGTREALFTSSQCTSTFWTDIEPEEVVDFGLLWSMHQGRLHFRWNLNDLNGPKWSWWSAASEGGRGGGTPLCKLYKYVPPHRISSLRSRRLEIVATRKNARERRRHACLPRARPFSLPPATSKPLLRGLRISGRIFATFWSENGYTLCPFWSGIGYGFRGTTGAYESIYRFTPNE